MEGAGGTTCQEVLYDVSDFRGASELIRVEISRRRSELVPWAQRGVGGRRSRSVGVCRAIRVVEESR